MPLTLALSRSEVNWMTIWPEASRVADELAGDRPVLASRRGVDIEVGEDRIAVDQDVEQPLVRAVPVDLGEVQADDVGTCRAAGGGWCR